MANKKTRSASLPKNLASPAVEQKTLRAIAKLLGVHRTTLENWRADCCPGLPPGKVDLDAVRAWARKSGKMAASLKEPAAVASREAKLMEEIRKLRLANDQKEGRLVERAWVAERVQRAAGDLNSFRTKSEAEHPTRFAAASGDVAKCRTIVRGIWDEVFAAVQSMKKHLEEGS